MSHIFLLYLLSHKIPIISKIVCTRSLIISLLQIASAPVSTLAATLNIEAAFRTVPIDPVHKAYTVVNFNGFWLDHVHPFGCTSSGGNHSKVADFTIDAWRALGVGPADKWVDNFIVFASLVNGHGMKGSPFTYNYDLAGIKQMVEPLGIPWHPLKGQEFGLSFDYVGFHWDLIDCTVALSNEKNLKFKACADQFRTSFAAAPASLGMTMTLNGSLSHIVFAYPHGHAYLPNICAFISSFKGNHFIQRHPPHLLLTDLAWWSSTLNIVGWTRSLNPPLSVIDLGIYVDASTSWGIGLIWDNSPEWDAWKLKDSQ